MWVRTSYVLGLVAALSIVADAASAGGRRAHKVPRQEIGQAPLRDCTRINGRSGYYGNPWCNARQQALWDRWSDRRRWVR